MAVDTIDTAWREDNVLGDAGSGKYKPLKAPQRRVLKRMEALAAAGVVHKATLALLDAVTPPAETYGGAVYDDPTPANNGIYVRDAGDWVRIRGFPDTLARLTITGGTADAVQASVADGVDPAGIVAFYIDVTTPNTGNVTVAIGGAAAIPAYNVGGNQFAPGEWAGRLFLSNHVTSLKALNDASAAISAAASAAIAVQAAADAMGGLGKPFDNKAAAEAYTPDTDPEFIQLSSYSSADDGGQMQLRATPANAEPFHGAKVMINTGRWFEITPQGRINVKPFGVRGNGATDDTDRSNEALEYAAGRPIEFPVGIYPITGDGLIIADTSEMELYRSGPKIFGQGKNTIFLNNANGACFKHPVAEAQGDNNYFTRGVELAHFQIIGDGSTPAESDGIRIQGSYHPWIHDLIINGMTGNAINATRDTTGWVVSDPNPDRYAVADLEINRCNLSSNIRSGILIENVACQPKVSGCYIVSNLRAGILASGSVGEVHGNSISGNGTKDEVNTGGIVLARDITYGTPQNWLIHRNEIDANWNNQIMLDAFKTVVEYNRFNDDPTWYPASLGQFMCQQQVVVRPSAGSGADGNRISNNSLRVTNTTDKTTIAGMVDLQSPGSRTAKDNIFEGWRVSVFDATSGGVTEYAETNGDSVYASGNRFATVAVPVGISKIVTSSKSMSDASGTQTIALGIKPGKVKVTAWVVGTQHKSEGEMSIDGVDNGLYYYPTNSGWYTHTGLITIRTASGDIYAATGTRTETGLLLTWTRTGAPTGTIDFIVTAEP